MNRTAMYGDAKIEQLRVPPQSVEAEQAVLGGLMIDPKALARITLDPADFYRRDHQLIFRAIQTLDQDGQPCDAVTVGEWFEGQGLSDQVANGAYLTELSSTTPGAANIVAYARIVREKSLLRELIDIGTEIVNHGFNCVKPSDVTAQAVTSLLQVAARATDDLLPPIDLFADHGFSTLDQSWLPPGVADYAWDQASIIGMPPELLAMGCLGTICAAMSDNFQLKVKRNEPWFERSRLWIMVIAPPGSKKSLALNKPMAPLVRIEKEIIRKGKRTLAEYEQAASVHAIQQKAAVKRKANNEGLDEELTPPTKPKNIRISVNNATTEMLGEMLADNPRGLHWYSDEMAVWFGLHDAYTSGGGGVMRGMALQAFDGGFYRFDRIGRGTIDIENFSYSLLGTTQPDKIKGVVKNMSDDGLLQRFITIEVPSQIIYGDDERLPDATFTKNWDDCIEMIWGWGCDGKGGMVEMDDEAQAIRNEFSKWITRVAGSEGLPDMMRGHVAKWEAIFPRLMLCYHAFGCAQSGKYVTNMKISARTAERAMNFMKCYLMPNAMRFFGATVSGGDQTYTLAKLIAGMVLGNNMLRVTNRDLQRAFKKWRDAPEWQKVSAIRLLKESGWLSGDDERRSSSAESGWLVNPSVHTMFGERALVERAKRQETTETLNELKGLANAQATAGSRPPAQESGQPAES